MNFPLGIGSSLLGQLQRLGGPFLAVSLAQTLHHTQAKA